MPSRKLLKSVLRGFLGTYVSRGSEFDGYLLFGFVLDSLSGADVDLTADVPSTPALVPLDELRRLAACKFREQLAKVGLPLSAVRNASLAIRKGPQRRSEVAVRGGLTKLSGFDLYFTARGVTDLGRAYEADAQMFVAPQDPSLFARSSRATNVCPTSASSGSAPTA